MSIVLGIENKQAKILVVESAASARQMMSAVLQSLGFKNLVAVDGIQSAFDYLCQEPADYLICPLSTEPGPNALEFLRTLRMNDDWMNLPVSLLVSDDGMSMLPSAFELGAVSWHPRYYSREAISKEFSRLLESLTSSGCDASGVALSYLFRFFVNAKRLDDALALTERYLSHFPESQFGRLIRAEALHVAGKTNEARTLFGQLRALGFANWWNTAKEYFSSESDVPPQVGFTPCLVVDSDETVHNNLRKIFEDFPEFRIVPFQSGLAADEWCRVNGPPGFVIQEWKLRDLPGPALLQRIRQRGWHDVPVLVLSSLVSKSDAPLLKEMGVTEVFRKPIIRESFIETVIQTLVQERDPTDIEILERKIARRLNMGHMDYANFLKEKLLRHPSVQPGISLYVSGLFAFANGEFESSRSLAMEAIQQRGDSLKCLTLLARSLVRLRDFDGAVKCFEKAASINPANVERLCELADVHSSLGDFEKASQRIDEAKVHDSSNELIANVESKAAIRCGDIERAQRIIMHMSQVSGLVSEMNNSAVALVKVGQFEQAVTLYRRTIDSLPEELLRTRLQVRYNLALAFARAGLLRECLAEFESFSLENLPNDVQMLSKKVKSLLHKVRRALEAKKPLRLIGEEVAEESIQIDQMESPLNRDGSEPVVKKIVSACALFGLFEASPADQKMSASLLSQGNLRTERRRPAV